MQAKIRVIGAPAVSRFLAYDRKELAPSLHPVCTHGTQLAGVLSHRDTCVPVLARDRVTRILCRHCTRPTGRRRGTDSRGNLLRPSLTGQILPPTPLHWHSSAGNPQVSFPGAPALALPQVSASVCSRDSSTLAEKCICIAVSLRAHPVWKLFLVCKYNVYNSGLISHYRSAPDTAKGTEDGLNGPNFTFGYVG